MSTDAVPAGEQVTLTAAEIDVFDHALEADGCHGFYADHKATIEAIERIVAERCHRLLVALEAAVEGARRNASGE